MSRVQRGSSNCSFHSFVDFKFFKMKNIQRTVLKSSFLTGYKADWKRGLKKLPRMQQSQRNRKHRLKTRGQTERLRAGASGWRARCGGRSTLCRAPCGPHGLHLPEASSTRCPTECNNRNVSGQCHRAQRAKVVQAEDPCRGVPPHWTSGEERDQRKAASEEREAGQFPELIRYVTYSDPYQAR